MNLKNNTEEVTKTLWLEPDAEVTKTLWLETQTEIVPPLTEGEVAALLSSMDQVALILLEEPINDFKMLKLAETERGTYSIYVSDRTTGIDVYITEKQNQADAEKVFAHALNLAKSREEQNLKRSN